MIDNCGDRYRYMSKGKCTDDGMWASGYLMEKYDGTYCIHTTGGVYEVDRYTICQCTGIRDKNDMLIYEGDICKTVVGITNNYVIIYENRIIRWNEYRWEGLNVDLKYNTSRSLEVIGNIYDNPELLPEGAE